MSPYASDSIAPRVPCFLLVPVALGYHPDNAIETRDGLALHWAPAATPGLFLVRPSVPFSLRLPLARPIPLPDPVVFKPTTFQRVRAYSRWERRQYARAGVRGRRGAIAVPVRQRWEARVYRPEGVGDEACVEMIYGRAGLVERTWRR